MFGFPSLYGFNAKAQLQVLVNKFGMKGNNMTNCPGGWLTEQKECCSSEEVWANLLQSLKLFIWERNPAKKGKCISEIYCFEGKHMQLKFMTLLVWGSPKVLNNGHNVMIKEAILLACKSIVKIFIFASSISKLFSPFLGNLVAFTTNCSLWWYLQKQLSALTSGTVWQPPSLLLDNAYFNTGKFHYCHALFLRWSGSALDCQWSCQQQGRVIAWNFSGKWERLNGELIICSFFFATATATFNRSLYFQGFHFFSSVRPKVPWGQLISLFPASANGEIEDAEMVSSPPRIVKYFILKKLSAELQTWFVQLRKRKNQAAAWSSLPNGAPSLPISTLNEPTLSLDQSSWSTLSLFALS